MVIFVTKPEMQLDAKNWKLSKLNTFLTDI